MGIHIGIGNNTSTFEQEHSDFTFAIDVVPQAAFLLIKSLIFRVGLVSVGWGLLADGDFYMKSIKSFTDIRYYFLCLYI